MDSLVTEISCSLNLNHQQTTSISISHSPPPAISSAARPPTTALLSADKSKKSTSPLLPLPPSRPLFPSPLKFLWFGRDHNPSNSPSKPSDNSLISSEIAEIDTEDLPSTSNTCTCFTDNEYSASDAELMDINHIKNAEEMHVTSRKNIATDSNRVTQGYSNKSTTDSSIQGYSDKCTTNSAPASVPTDKSWISRFLRSRLLWKAASDPDLNSTELVESALLIAATEADQALRVAAIDSDCIDNDINDGEINGGCGRSDDEQGGCMLQASHEKRVVHDRQSLSMFLHEVPVAEVQAISKLCLLSNLAYIIPEVQSKHLLKDHQLSFVTSSIVKKEEAEAKLALERSAIHASKQKNRRVQKLKIQEENAVSNKASCVDEGFDKTSSSSELTMCTEALLEEETINLASQSQDVKSAEGNSSLEETKDKTAKEATSKVQGSCPCEWFICDDEASSTRYLVIQGSESLASWQTNLSFAPTKFEGLGVLVHRGVYEAAQGLYKMVEGVIEEHIKKGSHARVSFTGHSLGGSLATLLAMMLVKRGVVSASAVDGVVTLGAPCVLCVGERLLEKLGLQERQFVNVVMHRDIVPRAFACDYPDHVVLLLKRVNSTFRDHPCLNFQRLLYAPVGQVMILQPGDAQSPSHPLLPTIAAGLYLIKHPHKQDDEPMTSQAAMEVREAERAFFNMPHPLDMLRDPGAYGFEGAISRDHDPRSYKRAINTVIAQGLRRLRRLGRLIGGPLDQPCTHLAPPPPLSSPRKHDMPNTSSRLIASQPFHMGLLFILSIPMDLFSSFLSWT